MPQEHTLATSWRNFANISSPERAIIITETRRLWKELRELTPVGAYDDSKPVYSVKQSNGRTQTLTKLDERREKRREELNILFSAITPHITLKLAKYENHNCPIADLFSELCACNPDTNPSFHTPYNKHWPKEIVKELQFLWEKQGAPYKTTCAQALLDKILAPEKDEHTDTVPNIFRLLRKYPEILKDDENNKQKFNQRLTDADVWTAVETHLSGNIIKLAADWRAIIGYAEDNHLKLLEQKLAQLLRQRHSGLETAPKSEWLEAIILAEKHKKIDDLRDSIDRRLTAYKHAFKERYQREYTSAFSVRRSFWMHREGHHLIKQGEDLQALDKLKLKANPDNSIRVLADWIKRFDDHINRDHNRNMISACLFAPPLTQKSTDCSPQDYFQTFRVTR